MRYAFLFATLILFVSSCSQTTPIQATRSELKIDIQGFQELTDEVREFRSKRLIGIEQFNQYAKETNTLILDTRSKAAYDKVHIKGAVHLNFSDFTEQKLAKIVPSVSAKILIYCNNNLRSRMEALSDKNPKLALNIPTFINLYGYGYRNIYELDDYLDDSDERLDLITQ